MHTPLRRVSRSYFDECGRSCRRKAVFKALISRRVFGGSNSRSCMENRWASGFREEGNGLVLSEWYLLLLLKPNPLAFCFQTWWVWGKRCRRNNLVKDLSLSNITPGSCPCSFLSLLPSIMFSWALNCEYSECHLKKTKNDVKRN